MQSGLATGYGLWVNYGGNGNEYGKGVLINTRCCNANGEIRWSPIS
jgi:hypothetical protein